MAGIIPYYDTGSSGPAAATQDWPISAAVIPSGWTYTRSGPAMGRGADGRWLEVGDGVPPTYYSPAGLTDLGVLIDGACTQYLFRTDSGITFGTYNVSFVTDTTTQTPFGKGVLKATADAVTDYHTAWLVSDGTPPDNSDATFDMVLKPIGSAGLTQIVCKVQGKDGVDHYATFSLTGAGTVVKVDSGSTARIYQDTDGFYRCQLSKNVATGTTAPSIQFVYSDNAGNGSYAATGQDGFLIAYVGFVSGVRPGAPIVNTTGAIKTRNAATLSPTNLSWFATGAATFGVECGTFEVPVVDAQILHLAKASSDGIGLAFLPGKIQGRFDVAGARVATLDGPDFSLENKVTAVLSAETNDFRLAVNGTNAASATSGTRPSSFSTLTLGSRIDGNGHGAVCVKRIKYWALDLPASDAATYSGNLGTTSGGTGGGSPGSPTLTIQPTAAATSGSTQIVLSILSTAGSAATVGVRTKPGTAVAGTDYVSVDTQVSLAAGDAAKSVSIPLLGSGATTDKTFTVEMYGPTGATLGSTIVSTVTISASVGGLPQPSYKWDFTTHSSETITLPAGWTLTRSGAAPGRSAVGQWKSYAANIPRPWFDTSGTFRGLFLDPGGTNLVHDSTGGLWANNADGDGIHLTTTTGTSPFDPAVGITLYACRETTVNDSHGLPIFWFDTVSADTLAANTDYCVSWLVKPQGRTQLTLEFKGTDGTTKRGNITMTGNGVVNSADAGCIVTIEPEYGGWYWISIARNTGPANGNPYTGIYLTAANSYVGDPTLGFDLAHVQLQAGLKRTAPIVNLGTGVSVSATGDNLRPNNLFWIPTGGSGAFGFKGFPVTLPAAGTTSAYAVSLEGSNASATLDWQPAPNWTVRLSNTATGTHQDAASYGQFAEEQFVATWSRSSVYAVNGGGTSLGLDSGTYATPDTWTSLRIGAAADGSHGASMVIERLQFWSLLTQSDANSFSTNLDATGGGSGSSTAIVSLPTTAGVTEGQSATVTLTKTGSAAGSVTVTSADGTATAGSDYTAVSQTVSFLASDASKTITITAASDSVTEGTETFRLGISPGTGTLVGNAATNVSVSDNTTVVTPATFTVPASAVVNEDAGSVTVRVSNTGGGPASVQIATANGTAVAGTHYTAVNQTLSFSATDTFKDVSIAIINNSLSSGSVSFTVNLSNATGGSIQAGSGTCTVTVNNVTPPATIYDLTAATLPSGVTYTRSGTDYVSKADGSLLRRSANVYAPEYVNGVDAGARIAKARTNLCQSPEAHGSSPWQLQGATVSATGISDPAGGTGAVALTGNASQCLEWQVISVTAGTAMRFGCWMKVPSGTLSFRIALDNADASGNWVSTAGQNEPISLTTSWKYFETTGTIATGTTKAWLTLGSGTFWPNGQTIHFWGGMANPVSEDPFYGLGSIGADTVSLPVTSGTHDIYVEAGDYSITKYAAEAVTGGAWTVRTPGSTKYIRRVSIDSPFPSVVYDFTQNTLPTGATYLRSGTDYVTAADGVTLVRRTANAYAPDHDGSGKNLGARIAGARTNLCQSPEAIGDSTWILSSCSLASGIADPASGTGASALTASSTTNPGALIHQVVSSLASGASMRWGAWLKVPSGTMAFRIAMDNADSSGNWLNVAAEKSIALTSTWQYFEVTATMGSSGYGWITLGSGNTWTNQTVHAWGGWLTTAAQDDFYGIGSIGADTFTLPISTGTHDIYVENTDLSVTKFAAESVTGSAWTLRPAAGSKWVRRVSVDGPFDASNPGGSTGGGGGGGGGGPTTLPSLSGIPTGAPFTDDDVVPTPRASPVNVTTFGAVGDDSTDCTTAFINAVASARAQAKDVYVPAGTFRIGMVSISGTMLYGSGDGSILKTTAAGNRTLTLGDNATLWGIQIVAANVAAVTANANDAAVTITGTAARVTNCLITGAGNVGIVVNGAANVVIDHNRVQGTAGGGIAFTNGAQHWRCHHNLVKGTAGDSIAAVHLRNVATTSGRTGQGRIWSNEVTGNTTGRGIVLAGCDTVIVEGNNVHDNDQTNYAGYAGIYIACLTNSGALNCWQTTNWLVRQNIVSKYGGAEAEILCIQS